MRCTSTTSILLALALLTTTAFASQSWEPEHSMSFSSPFLSLSLTRTSTNHPPPFTEYDYRLPGREYRTAALHLSDSIQLHLPATLNNRLPYTPEDFFQHPGSHLAQSTAPLLLPYTLFNTSHGFLGALLCVAVVLGAVLAASRVVRMARRRRFFAGRTAGAQQDYILSPAFETPKRKLRVSMLGLGLSLIHI